MDNTVFLNTNREMPLLGLGVYKATGENEAENAIISAVESGYRLIDTASVYKNEENVGRGIASCGIPRNELFITTKVWNTAQRLGDIQGAFERSLDRLKLDYVDLYLIHWPDVKVPFQETMEALTLLKEQGKVLHVGVSNFSVEQMEEAGKYCPIEAYQPQYSMVCRSNEAQIKWAAEQGMGVMAYGSLGAGILTGAYRTLTNFPASDNRSRFYKHFQEPMFSKVMKLLGVMDEIAAQRQVPLSQIAINWAAQKPFISSCIVGAQTRKKIEENCACFDWSLTETEMRTLDEAIHRYLDTAD